MTPPKKQNVDEPYTDEEAQRRFEAALKAALKAPPKKGDRAKPDATPKPEDPPD